MRADQIKKGVERAPNRSLLYALGYTEEELNRPLVGVVGAGTMIDMGAVLGGRATVGKNCHIGAGTVLAGVIEPASAVPVVIEDDVVIGANSVVLEGCRVGKGAVVAAGAVVVSDVAPNTVVAGVPARVLKDKDGKTAEKTALIDALRAL